MKLIALTAVFALVSTVAVGEMLINSCVLKWVKYEKTHASGLVQRNGLVTETDCASACELDNGCLNVDFNFEEKSCWFGSQLNPPKSADPSANHWNLVRDCTNENLALKKKATQSSTLASDIAGLASYAVDGVADGDWTHKSCAHTENESPAWWAVDLGEETKVGRVRITSRNMLAERLSNFYIGLTNVSPWTSAPRLSTSSICIYSAGYPPANVPTNFICDPGTESGRYLFVLLKNQNYLTICELEAYDH
jgi:hypothetical protein